MYELCCCLEQEALDTVLEQNPNLKGDVAQ
jgi:hypothetical protein